MRRTMVEIICDGCGAVSSKVYEADREELAQWVRDAHPWLVTLAGAFRANPEALTFYGVGESAARELEALLSRMEVG